MDLRELSWGEIKPIWDKKLWPGRNSDPVSSMKYLGGYDMSLKKKTPIFVGITVENHIIAVNSFVHTGGTQWRSRGLWVDPEYRRQGHAKALLKDMFDFIRGLGGTTVWTMPRQESLEVYQSVGFERTTDWFEQGWGTNCYALVNL